MIKIKQGELLSKHSYIGIGGLADHFVEVHDTKELKEALAYAEKEGVPYYVIGGGSNLLFDDEGYRGLIIQIKGDQIGVKQGQIWAQAGAPLAKLVQYAAKSGRNASPLGMIPGTVGGAIVNNASNHGLGGADMATCLSKIKLLEISSGKIKSVDSKWMRYGYRQSRLKHVYPKKYVVLEGWFDFAEGDGKEELKKIGESRRKNQPSVRSLGSFFVNPPGDSAGRLIDQAGLKGYKMGQAGISDQHANFLYNRGEATALNILALAKHVQEVVEQKFGVRLEMEVEIVPKK